MKRTAALLLCIILLFSAVSLVSCNASSKDGKSAYEIAKENGYTGTEEQWLESLRGESGTGITIDGTDFTAEELYETAKEYGYNGTFLDFLTAYVLNGNPGSTEESISTAILSCVSIYSTFKQTLYYPSYGGYKPYESEYYSAGSGVIYQMDKEAGDAYIITNYHVVYSADSSTEDHISDNIKVWLYGAISNEANGIQAEYIGGSMTYDIAVLKIENSQALKQSSAHSVTVANSDGVVVGNQAVAIGNPESYGISATAGIVSVDSEYITMTATDEVSQVTMRVMRVDTPVNSGNSGGGLFNSSGELIGIVNAKIVDTSTENIGYAIPSNIATYVADSIIENYNDGNDGTFGVTKCLLGVTVSVTDSRAVYSAADKLTYVKETVTVSSVEAGGLADGSLQAGDVIVSIEIDGVEHQITRQFMLIDLMLTCRVGDTVTQTVLRNGKEKSFSFTLTEESITPIA